MVANFTYLQGIPIFTNPSTLAGYDTRSIFKWSLTGWNSKFSFSKTSCLTKAEEPSLPYYLPIAGGRIIGFIPFLMVLVLCEMQSVLSRIWTHVAVSISYDDNHYITGTSVYRVYHRHIVSTTDWTIFLSFFFFFFFFFFVVSLTFQHAKNFFYFFFFLDKKSYWPLVMPKGNRKDLFFLFLQTLHLWPG